MRRPEMILLKTFEEAYKYYRGYVFEYEHPGYFVYHQLGSDLSVYFTPDFNEPGQVPVEVHMGDKVIADGGVVYTYPLTAASLFRAVVPYLDENARF